MGVGKGVISKRMGLITTGTLLGWLYIAYHGLKKIFKNDGFLDCEPKSLQLHPGEKGNIRIVKKSHRAPLSWFSSNEETASVDSHGGITTHKNSNVLIYGLLDDCMGLNAVSEAHEAVVKTGGHMKASVLIEI